MFEKRWNLMSILRELKMGKMDTFDERMINQKAVYLLSKFGMKNLSYPYNWHVRGPYSPHLAEDLFHSEPLLKLIDSKYVDTYFENGDETIISTFNSFYSDLEEIHQGEKSSLKLELVASMVYLADIVPKSRQHEKKEIIFNSIPQLKSHFDGWDLEPYWTLLQKHGLV